MHGDDVGARLGEGFEDRIAGRDHQMHVENLLAVRAQRLHHVRPDGDVGHEMPVHHVHMDPVGSGGLRPHGFPRPIWRNRRPGWMARQGAGGACESPHWWWRFRSPHHSAASSEMRTSEPKPHQINKLLVSLRFRSSQMPQSEANFGIGTLGTSGRTCHKSPGNAGRAGSFTQCNGDLYLRGDCLNSQAAAQYTVVLRPFSHGRTKQQRTESPYGITPWLELTPVVLGAGIVGTSIALHLAKRGLSVALVDRGGPGEETSYGNAGVIEGETVFPPYFPPGLLAAQRRHQAGCRKRIITWPSCRRSRRWLFAFWLNPRPRKLAGIRARHARRCFPARRPSMKR